MNFRHSMLNPNLAVYLAHADDGQRKVLEAKLQLLTHHVELSTASPAILKRRCQENPPAVAVVGAYFDDDHQFDLLNELSQIETCPIVAILKQPDLERSRRLIKDSVMGVLVEPANEADLRTAIYLACRRFEQSKAMKRRILDLEDELRHLDASSEDSR